MNETLRIYAGLGLIKLCMLGLVIMVALTGCAPGDVDPGKLAPPPKHLMMPPAKFPTLKPGQHLDKVEVYTAPDGTEKFNKAFKALDGALNLLGGTGARLLVVVSDGCYIAEERAAARKWMAECQRANVGVLWLTFDDGRDTRDCTRGSNAVVMTDLKSPEDIATEIGAAAAKALTAVS